MTGAALICLCATALPPAADDSGVAPARAPKVLLIGIDGCRPDVVHRANAPNLHRLIENGCWSDRSHTGALTASGPGWASVLTGVWMAKHNVKDNTFRGAAFDRWPHFFARLKEARPALRLASFVSWPPLEDYLTPRATEIQFAHDRKDGGDALVTEAASSTLASDAVDVAFVYFCDVDEAGHKFGFDAGIPEYRAAVETTDAEIGRVLESVRSRPTFAAEDWLVMVTPDHGGRPDGSHGRDVPADREIFYIVSGDDAARGRILDTVNQVDVVTTAMAHLGIAARPAWGLDGRVRGLRGPQKHLDENLVDNGDAEASEPAVSQDVNLGIPGWVDLGAMTTLAYGAVPDFPAKESPGPRARGSAFFAAAGKDASMTQMIDLRDFTRDVDAGSIEFELGAWMGGCSSRRDMASVSVAFLDMAGTRLAGARLTPGPVEERRSAFGVTDRRPVGMIERYERGPVPRGACAAEVTLEIMCGQGECDGYADNISLVLTRR